MSIKAPLLLNEDVVYVASPYQGLLDCGKEISDIRRYANDGITAARKYFEDDFLFFSPVLYFTDFSNYDKLERTDVMSICAKTVADGHVSLYIYYDGTPAAKEAILKSEGIFDEWMIKIHFSKNNIFSKIICDDPNFFEIHEEYKKKLDRLQEGDFPVSIKAEKELIKRGYL